MAEDPNDNEALLLLLAVLAVANVDDPEIAEYLLHSPIRDRLRRSSVWTPDLDDLLFRMPRVRRRAYERRLEQAREVAAVEARKFLGTFDATQTERVGDVAARVQRLERTSAEVDAKLREARDMLEETRRLADRITREREVLDAKVGGLALRVEEVDAGQRTLRDDVSTQRAEALSTENSLHSFVWLLSTGANVAEAEITRQVPVRMYVPDPVPDAPVLAEVVAAMEALLRSVGFEKSVDLPEESGSWWKRFWAAFKAAASHEDVQMRLRNAEQALELKYLDKPQAEANREQAEAAAKLITALEKVPRACIQAGSLLAVKWTDAAGTPSICVRTLNTAELKRLEQHQSILQRPDEILQWLACAPPPTALGAYDPRSWEQGGLVIRPATNTEQIANANPPLLLAGGGPSPGAGDPDPNRGT